MSSDIDTGFSSDNLVGFRNIPSFDHNYSCDEFLLRAISAGGSSPEDLSLPQLHDPSLQFQELLVFSSEGSMQRSYRSSCMGTGGGGCRGEGLIRRAYSMGDLLRRAERYSAEERKVKIRKYREKRNLRNFNKTIKYECRKTLADGRPRIRGRFAPNDDVVGDGDTSNDNAITLPTLHHHVVSSSSSSWQWNHMTKEYNYGCVKGRDALVTSLFLPQNN